MNKLFSPITIRELNLKNRIVVSPMCQYSAEDGFANDWHLVHLGSRAVGGAGLVIMEATGVSPEGRISSGDLGIWKDDHIAKFSQIASFIKRQGAVAGIQLAHAGRKASMQVPWIGQGKVTVDEGGWQPLAPSPLAYSVQYHMPAELDQPGIKKIIADFKAGAQRALRAGFEVIEIHAAHGYLLHEFLSPLTNKRSDDYGGSFENRSRLLLEIAQSIYEILPAHLPLFARITGTDWADGGLTAEDSVALARLLKEVGVEVIDVTSGGLIPQQKIPVGPAYQLPFASKIKKETGMITSTVGMITNAKQAESILVNGDADLIMMAREFLRDPYFPLRAAHELKVDIEWPLQYERGKF